MFVFFFGVENIRYSFALSLIGRYRDTVSAKSLENVLIPVKLSFAVIFIFHLFVFRRMTSSPFLYMAIPNSVLM
jgi:hypothetical protein